MDPGCSEVVGAVLLVEETVETIVVSCAFQSDDYPLRRHWHLPQDDADVPGLGTGRRGNDVVLAPH